MTCLGCGTPAPGGWAPCVSVDALMRCAATEDAPEMSGTVDERSGKIADESGPFRPLAKDTGTALPPTEDRRRK